MVRYYTGVVQECAEKTNHFMIKVQIETSIKKRQEKQDKK